MDFVGSRIGMLSERGFRRYCERVRDSGEWGGEPEVSTPLFSLPFVLVQRKLTNDPIHPCTQILALSRYYQIPIHVIQSNHPKIVAHSPDPKARATLDPKSARKIKAVRISYHRRLYGLGEHYVRFPSSLRFQSLLFSDPTDVVAFRCRSQNSLRKITYTLSAFSAMVCVTSSPSLDDP